jgi:hypothetical protein
LAAAAITFGSCRAFFAAAINAWRSSGERESSIPAWCGVSAAAGVASGGLDGAGDGFWPKVTSGTLAIAERIEMTRGLFMGEMGWKERARVTKS